MCCNHRLLVTAALALLASASTLSAATLVVNGSVSVNTGSGFRPVTSGTEVNPGDRIMVGNGGSAQIVYNATCTASVLAGAIATVSATAPCTPTSPPSSTNTGLIIGGAAVGGGVGLAFALSQDSSTPSKRPASP